MRMVRAGLIAVPRDAWSSHFPAGVAVARHSAKKVSDGHELAEGLVGPPKREQTKVPADGAGQLRVQEQRNPKRATAIRSAIVESLLEACIEVDGEEVPLLQLMRLDSMINDRAWLVENARLACIDQPMEVIGLGTLEQLAPVPPFA